MTLKEKEIEMSLTNTAKATTVRKGFDLRNLGTMVATIVAAGAIAVGAAQMINQPTGAPSPAAQQSSPWFYELNTSALPKVSVIEPSVPRPSAIDNFVELNTVAMPAANSALTQGPSDHFLQWNTSADAAESKTAEPIIRPGAPR